jgi:hypothetical protein
MILSKIINRISHPVEEVCFSEIISLLIFSLISLPIGFLSFYLALKKAKKQGSLLYL